MTRTPGMSAKLAPLTAVAAVALLTGACASGRNMMLAGSGGDQAAFDEVFDEETYGDGSSGSPNQTTEAASYNVYGGVLVRSGNAPGLGGGVNGLTATATGAVRNLTTSPLLGAATVSAVVTTLSQTTAALAPATGAATGLVAATVGAIPAAGSILTPVSATAAALSAPVPVAGALVGSTTTTTATLTERLTGGAASTTAAVTSGNVATGAISTTTATVRALPGSVVGGLRLGR